MLVFAVIVFSFATNIADLQSYKNNYMYGGTISEPIYVGLVTLFKTLHFDYTVFRTFLCCLGMFFILKSILELSPYPTMVFMMYLIYPFCIDAVQVRSFVASAFVIYAIRYIIFYQTNKKKSNIFLFLIFILIAAGFHYSAILFIFLAVLFLNIKKNMIFVYFILPIIIFLLLSQLSSFEIIVRNITGTTRASSWLHYDGEIAASYIRIFRLLSTRLGFVLMLFLWSKVKTAKLAVSENNLNMLNQNQRFADSVTNKYLFLCIAYITLYTILDIVLAGDFERLYRVAIILGSILMSRQIYVAEESNKNIMWVISFTAYILYFLSIMIGMSVGGSIYLNCIFRMLMENNPFS